MKYLLFLRLLGDLRRFDSALNLEVKEGLAKSGGMKPRETDDPALLEKIVATFHGLNWSVGDGRIPSLPPWPDNSAHKLSKTSVRKKGKESMQSWRLA